MPMVVVPASSEDRRVLLHEVGVGPTATEKNSATTKVVTDAIAKDAILAWFRSEFAAANAIIDALCGHVAQLSDDGVSEYEAVFGAIHRRRMNWIPVIQMQKYHSIAEVAVELRKLAEKKAETETIEKNEDDQEDKVVDQTAEDGEIDEKVKMAERQIKFPEYNDTGKENAPENDDSVDGDNTDSGCEGVQPIGNGVCANHQDCGARPAQIKLTKGFSAKESLRGHMVNVVKGLKLYENIFTDSELSKLNDFVNNLRSAGQNGELLGETFILFNQQIKGNRRELIQLGIPLFRQIKEDGPGNIEPIPVLLQAVVDHLVQWQLIPEYKKPNGCIINFFEEEEHSQPFQKPPHLDQPIFTLFLSESSVVLGRTLVSDNKGNYKGPLVLNLTKGSLLVMRGHSADMARHVVSQSPIKRVSITFFRVRPEANQCQPGSAFPLAGNVMAPWQPAIPSGYSLPNGQLCGYEAMDVVPQLGILCAPVLTLAPMVLSHGDFAPGGTGVFLPWTMSSRKPAKYLPPRARKGKLLALASIAEKCGAESTPDPC